MLLLFRIYLSKGPGYPLAKIDLVLPPVPPESHSAGQTQPRRAPCMSQGRVGAAVGVNVPCSFVCANQRLC